MLYYAQYTPGIANSTHFLESSQSSLLGPESHYSSISRYGSVAINSQTLEVDFPYLGGPIVFRSVHSGGLLWSKAITS